MSLVYKKRTIKNERISLLAALIVALASCQNTNTQTAKHTNDLSIVLEESNKWKLNEEMKPHIESGGVRFIKDLNRYF